MDIIEQIEEIFRRHGNRCYDGARVEPVSALEHALQCAQLAEWARADTALVAAALLHDIGHLIDTGGCGDAVDDVHELRSVGLLASSFPAAVLEPIRLHVQAKRYLVALDPSYEGQLTPASAHSLCLQGGAFDAAQMHQFEDQPHAEAAVMLRRWDDQAKTPGRRTPPLAYYLNLLEDLRDGARLPRRTIVGAFDA